MTEAELKKAIFEALPTLGIQPIERGTAETLATELLRRTGSAWYPREQGQSPSERWTTFLNAVREAAGEYAKTHTFQAMNKQVVNSAFSLSSERRRQIVADMVGRPFDKDGTEAEAVPKPSTTPDAVRRRQIVESMVGGSYSSEKGAALSLADDVAGNAVIIEQLDLTPPTRAEAIEMCELMLPMIAADPDLARVCEDAEEKYAQRYESLRSNSS